MKTESEIALMSTKSWKMRQPNMIQQNCKRLVCQFEIKRKLPQNESSKKCMDSVFMNDLRRAYRLSQSILEKNLLKKKLPESKV